MHDNCTASSSIKDEIVVTLCDEQLRIFFDAVAVRVNQRLLDSCALKLTFLLLHLHVQKLHTS